MINAEGLCWCGQRWDGENMCPPGLPGDQAGEATAGAGLAEKTSPRSDD
jgi:hypothetical protein